MLVWGRDFERFFFFSLASKLERGEAELLPEKGVYSVSTKRFNFLDFWRFIFLGQQAEWLEGVFFLLGYSHRESGGERFLEGCGCERYFWKV